MNFAIKISGAAVLLSFSWLSFAAEQGCDPACQLSQIQAYFSAMDKVSQANASEKEIDGLLALLHNDVNYIHVEYQASFNKETWRQAFVRNLKRGAYHNGPDQQIQILNTIYGKNHTAVAYAHSTRQADGSWVTGDSLLVLFGFNDGKIVLVKELW